MKLYAGQRLLLIKDWTFRAGVSVGTLPAGTEITIDQIDLPQQQALVHFGLRDFAWYPISTINEYCRTKN